MGKYEINTYSVFVDYGMNIGEAIKQGKYFSVDDNITQNNFPTKRKGKANIEIKLFFFRWCLSHTEVLETMDKAVYQPAELHEILALGEKYPNLQRDFPIYALGSIWWSSSSCCALPYLCDFRGTGSGRSLRLQLLGHSWYGDPRFAAVRK